MNANEPAFPLHFKDRLPSTGEETTREQWCGMTKREYFAGLALQAYVSSNRCNGRGCDAAIIAVEYANTLLAELARTEPKDSK